jgi:hypothetical protein
MSLIIYSLVCENMLVQIKNSPQYRKRDLNIDDVASQIQLKVIKKEHVSAVTGSN